jgi:hypothetical protein
MPNSRVNIIIKAGGFFTFGIFHSFAREGETKISEFKFSAIK